MIVGNQTISLSLSPNETLYDALKEAQISGKISLSGTTYPGLGFFITSIDTLKSGNGKNLMYYINGTQATVGISTYIPHNGDIVMWELEK